MRSLLFLLTLVPAIALSSEVGPTKTFTSGETLTAGDLNNNFDAQTTAINDNATQLGTHTTDPSAHHNRYTDNEAVSAVKAADGNGSGFDADTLDGLEPTDFAGSNQTCASGSIVSGIDPTGGVICSSDIDTVRSDAEITTAMEPTFVGKAAPSWDTRTGYISIPPTAFFQYQGGNACQITLNGSWPGLVYVYAPPGCALFAPVNLPHGATVTRMTVYYVSPTTDTTTAYLRRISRDMTTSEPVAYGDIGQTATGTATAVGVDISTIVTTTNTVDNANWTYQFLMNSIVNDGIASILIEYTYTEPY